MRLIAAALLALFASPAAAEMNLCWSSSNTWQRCEAGRSVWSRANEAPAQDYSGGAFRDFAAVASSEAVYVCTADRPVGSGAGCPSDGVYTHERFVPKSSLGAAPAPPSPVDPPPPSGTGTMLLTWTQPTTNDDGSPVTLIANRAYWGTGPTTLDASVTIQPPATSYLITGLAAGTWYAAVTAVSSSGESGFSNVVSKTVAETSPPPPADPCVADPFTFRVRSWPGAPTGDRTLGYSTDKPIARIELTQTATRVTGVRATDDRGCVVAVAR